MFTWRQLVIRNLLQDKWQSFLSTLAITTGVGMTLAAEITGDSILNSISSSTDAQSFMHGLIDQLDRMLIFIGLIISLTAGFLVYNAFGMSVVRRWRQIGSLRSIGMSRSQILSMLTAEGLIIGCAGTICGIIIGPLLANSTLSLLDKFLGEGIFVSAGQSITFSSVALSAFLGIGVSFFSVLIPSYHATQIAPLAARRQAYADTQASPNSRLILLGFAIWLGMTVIFLLTPPARWVTPPWDVYLTIIFTVLWLSSIALVTPYFLNAFSRSLIKAGISVPNMTSRWVGENLQRDRKRLITTILTMTLALTTIMSVTGFIRYSFDELMRPRIEGTFALGGWIITQFEFYRGMSAYSHLDTLSLSPEIITDAQTYLVEHANIMAWRFVIVPELSFWGSTYFSFLIDLPTISQAGDSFFDFTEGDWEFAINQANMGCAVLISPLVAARNNVEFGDQLFVSGESGPVSCTVAGIGAPYVGASIISASASESFGSPEPMTILVWPRTIQDRKYLENALAELKTAHPEAKINELAELASIQIRVLEALPDMLAALMILAIVTAALGVLNTTMMNVKQRTHELLIMRTVGASRRQVISIVIWEAFGLGWLAGVLALIAGSGVIVILAVVYGGVSWGIPDLDIWSAAGRSLLPTLRNGIIGLFATPLICALSAWYPINAFMKRSSLLNNRDDS